MPRRRYTHDEKVAAVGIAAVEGVTEAERQTGIPKQTIDYWLDKPEFGHLLTKTQEDRALQFGVVAQLAIDRLVRLIPSMKPHDLIILAGVATDKAQLLSGAATSRTETRDLTDIFDDHEKAVLGDAIRDELARRADVEAPVPAVGDPGEAGAAPA
jgi:hypothetical protein